MTDRHRIRRALAHAFLFSLLAASAARADWALSPPGDLARQWRVSLNSSVGYDNNSTTAATNKQGSLTYAWSPTIEAHLPGERTSGQLRYTYTSTYYGDRTDMFSKPDEAHVFDANISHTFTPRLTASLSETFRRGIEPTLVGPIITRERGDYGYNLIGASLNFELTSRWNLSLNQTWERWMFDEADQRTTNDRNDYGTTASAIFQMDSRTTVGLNYTYSRASYSDSNPTNLVRDSDAQAIYLSWTHRFKPLVYLQASVGAQLAGFGGGGSDASPYLSFSATYNFEAKSTISLGMSYNIQLSELASYRSSDQMASFLTLSHQFTPKLNSSLSFNYIVASYRNLNPLFRNPFDLSQVSSVEEDSWQVDMNTTYSFNRWGSVFVNFFYQDLSSGFDNRATATLRSFNRMGFNVGVGVGY